MGSASGSGSAQVGARQGGRGGGCRWVLVGEDVQPLDVGAVLPRAVVPDVLPDQSPQRLECEVFVLHFARRRTLSKQTDNPSQSGPYGLTDVKAKRIKINSLMSTSLNHLSLKPSNTPVSTNHATRSTPRFGLTFLSRPYALSMKNPKSPTQKSRETSRPRTTESCKRVSIEPSAV